MVGDPEVASLGGMHHCLLLSACGVRRWAGAVAAAALRKAGRPIPSCSTEQTPLAMSAAVGTGSPERRSPGEQRWPVPAPSRSLWGCSSLSLPCAAGGRRGNCLRLKAVAGPAGQGSAHLCTGVGVGELRGLTEHLKALPSSLHW